MSAPAIPASAQTTDITVLGFAEWWAKRQYPDVKKKERNREAQETTLLNRDICVYNTAAAIQNSIVFGVITTFVLTALRILNPIAGLLMMAAGAFVHYTTTMEMDTNKTHFRDSLLKEIIEWVKEVKEKNEEKPEVFHPVSHNLLNVDAFFRLAPYAKTKKEEPAEEEAPKTKAKKADIEEGVAHDGAEFVSVGPKGAERTEKKRPRD